jgi:hypothetical protein
MHCFSRNCRGNGSNKADELNPSEIHCKKKNDLSLKNFQKRTGKKLCEDRPFTQYRDQQISSNTHLQTASTWRSILLTRVMHSKPLQTIGSAIETSAPLTHQTLTLHEKILLR